MSAPGSTPPPRDNPLRVETRYQTYKAATASVAGWLARQAQKLGITTTKSGEARRKKAEGKDTGYALSIDDFFAFTQAIVDADPRIGIPLEIVSLAGKAYALRKEWAQILRGQDEESDKRHAHFISVIGQVYEQLQAHYQAHDLTGAWPAPPAQQQHRHQARQKHEQSKEESEAKKDKPANPFDVLSVEEGEFSDQQDDVASEAETATDTDAARRKAKKLTMKKKKSKAKKKKAQVQAKVDNEYEEEKRDKLSDGATYLDEGEVDPYFVIMCLLSDLSSMRNFVKELWTDYAHGKVDLATASLTTNATFDIIRTYKQDCPAIGPLLKDYSKTLQLVLSRRLEASDEHDKGLQYFFDGDHTFAHFGPMCSTLSQMEDLLDLTCAHAFYFLNGPRHDLFSNDHNARYADVKQSRDVYGPLVLGLNRSLLCYQDRLMHDIRLLTSFAQDVCINGVQDQFTPDHFTMQWHEFREVRNKTVSLSEAFGAQMYLDMQNLPGVDLSSALTDPQSKAGQLQKTWLKWESEELVKQRAMWSGKDRMCKHVFDGALEYLRVQTLLGSTVITYEDHFKARKNAAYLMAGRGERFDASRDRTLLQKHPLLCGIIQFVLIANSRQGGQLISVYPRSILSIGQLYFACRMHRRAAGKKETMLETGVPRTWPDFTSNGACWTDMEYMFEMFGEQAFFKGTIPSSNHAIAKSNSTLMNNKVGALQIPKGYIIDPGAPQLGEAPRLRIDSFVELVNFDAIVVSHELFMRKYAVFVSAKKQHALASAWTESSLLAIMGKKGSAWTSPELGDGRQLGNEERKGQAWSHVELLEALKRCLMSEARALHFDMLGFHMRCINLLTMLREKVSTRCSEVSVVRPSKIGGQSDRGIPFLGQNLIFVACAQEIFLGHWVTGRPSTKPVPLYTSRALVAIDKTMQDFLTENDCRSTEIDKVNAWHGIGSADVRRVDLQCLSERRAARRAVQQVTFVYVAAQRL